MLPSDNTDNEVKYRERTKGLLAALGVSTKRVGYKYTVMMVQLAIADPECLWGITKEMYPKVADFYGVKPQAVEAAIRRVSRLCWNEGNNYLFNEVAGYKMERPPTNFEFIEMLSVEIVNIKR